MSDTVEYRPVPDGRVADYQRFLDYAFTPTGPFRPPDSVEDLPPPSRVSDRRGLFDGDELRAVCGHFWLELSVRGGFRGVAGLAEVATLPEDRHQGYVGRLVRESLAEYRDRGYAFSALWPFEYSFYRRYGWETASRHARTTVDPGALRAALQKREHRDVEDSRYGADEFVRLDPSRWDEMDAVYARCNDRPLTMRRTETWWRNRTVSDWGADPYVYGVERGDELVGYLVYSFEERDRGRRLDVEEWGYVDGRARRDLLRFCHHHDSQIEEVRVHGPLEEALAVRDLLAEPDELDLEIRPGPMLRIVDVPGALEALAYPEDGDVVLSVEDPLLETNRGRFRLEAADGTATCESIDATADVAVDVGTLAQIVVGHRSVEAAATAGAIDGATESLATLFPPVDHQPYLRERF